MLIPSGIVATSMTQPDLPWVRDALLGTRAAASLEWVRLPAGAIVCFSDACTTLVHRFAGRTTANVWWVVAQARACRARDSVSDERAHRERALARELLAHPGGVLTLTSGQCFMALSSAMAVAIAEGYLRHWSEIEHAGACALGHGALVPLVMAPSNDIRRIAASLRGASSAPTDPHRLHGMLREGVTRWKGLDGAAVRLRVENTLRARGLLDAALSSALENASDDQWDVLAMNCDVVSPRMLSATLRMRPQF